MPFLERDGARIYYEVHGEGFPVLLLASGGMRSSIPYWGKAPWDAITRLSPHYQVIAMDQRNAGQSTAPITAADGWQTYTADQVALLDHLGVDRFHAVGMCIGGSYIMALADTVPERLASGVMLQPIGCADNHQTFLDMFENWVDEKRAEQPDVSDTVWRGFRDAMFGSTDLLFNKSEADVTRCLNPLLVLMGTDIYHPEFTSRRIAELAPNAVLIEKWKEPEHIADADAAIHAFLARNSGQR